VSATVTSQVAQRPSRHGMRVSPSGRLLSDLSKPCGSLMDGKLAFDNARHYEYYYDYYLVQINEISR